MAWSYDSYATSHDDVYCYYASLWPFNLDQVALSVTDQRSFLQRCDAWIWARLEFHMMVSLAFAPLARPTPTAATTSAVPRLAIHITADLLTSILPTHPVSTPGSPIVAAPIAATPSATGTALRLRGGADDNEPSAEKCKAVGCSAVLQKKATRKYPRTGSDQRRYCNKHGLAFQSGNLRCLPADAPKEDGHERTAPSSYVHNQEPTEDEGSGREGAEQERADREQSGVGFGSGIGGGIDQASTSIAANLVEKVEELGRLKIVCATLLVDLLSPSPLEANICDLSSSYPAGPPPPTLYRCMHLWQLQNIAKKKSISKHWLQSKGCN